MTSVARKLSDMLRTSVKNIVTTDSNNKLPAVDSSQITNVAYAAQTTKLDTPHQLRLTGDMTGSTPFDGSANATIIVTNGSPS